MTFLGHLFVIFDVLGVPFRHFRPISALLCLFSLLLEHAATAGCYPSQSSPYLDVIQDESSDASIRCGLGVVGFCPTQPNSTQPKPTQPNSTQPNSTQPLVVEYRVDTMVLAPSCLDVVRGRSGFFVVVRMGTLALDTMVMRVDVNPR